MAARPSRFPSLSFDAESAGLLDQVAHVFDEARPGYPPALVDDVLAWSELPERGEILEVGCGTGQATRRFAALGHRMLCLEPGPRLAELAARRLASFGGVEVESLRFEDWPLREGAFDLVISAQAFHWTDPAVSYTKAGRALRPGGGLALFWNRPQGTSPALHAAIQDAYARHAPDVEPWLERSLKIGGVRRGVAGAGLFEPLRLERYPWTERRTAEAYVELLHSQWSHSRVPEARRLALFDEIGTRIEEHGGMIDLDYTTLLYFTRRR